MVTRRTYHLLYLNFLPPSLHDHPDSRRMFLSTTADPDYFKLANTAHYILLPDIFRSILMLALAHRLPNALQFELDRRTSELRMYPLPSIALSLERSLYKLCFRY